MRRVTGRQPLALITIWAIRCLGQVAARFAPLTTVFTPAPECTSLTIVHLSRNVKIYTGCVGEDPTCCPSGRQNNTYSPGLCPTGYEAKDPHVGLDRLAIDTEEWEATCVPRPIWVVPQWPIGREDTYCPLSYTSQLPNLTTPITASVFYYDPTLAEGMAWPGTPGARTTTVISNSWPTLTPASTLPAMVIASHIVIRWREADFDPEKQTTKASGANSPASSITQILSSPSSHESFERSPSSNNAEKATSTNLPHHHSSASATGLSNGVLSAVVVGSIVSVSGGVLLLLVCYTRRKRRHTGGVIELDDREPIGCRIFYEDPVINTPEIDIVFVHGLRGHRIKTWTKDGCCWPRDLLPKQLPGARIITFGYDAKVAGFFSRASSNNINKHAESLLHDLRGLRQGGTKHPIIFVAHSLGGILVKDALRKSRNLSFSSSSVDIATRPYQDTPDGEEVSLLDATRGIIFLGTPHHGSSYANFGKHVARILSAVSRDTNVRLLRSIEPDSEILERISEDFRSIITRKRIRICSFVEELPMSYMLDPVVNHRSGYIGIDGEIRGTIHANHRDMCRFKDSKDPGFDRISKILVEFVAAAIHRYSDRPPQIPPPTRQREEVGFYRTE